LRFHADLSFRKALDSSKAAAAPLIGFASRPGTSALQSCEDRFVDRDTYQGLIERLEAESENRPAAYRTKVVLLSAAAYAVLFATLIAVAGSSRH